MSVNKLSLLSG